MKKALVSVLVLGLIGSVLFVPATAGAAKPVKTSLYLHGTYPGGEIDGVDWLVNSTPPMVMDKNKPSGSAPKSMNYSGPVFNDQCTGIPLVFPTWVGALQGTIVGDAHLHAHFMAAPATLTARIWVDTPVFSCNEGYIEPAQEVLVQIPAGHSEVDIVFKDLRLKATANVMIELLSQSPGAQGRVLYDSPDLASVLEFKCIPAKGKTCTP